MDSVFARISQYFKAHRTSFQEGWKEGLHAAPKQEKLVTAVVDRLGGVIVGSVLVGVAVISFSALRHAIPHNVDSTKDISR